MDKFFSVGDVMNPQADDHRFEDEYEAGEAAERKSIAHMGEMVVAVWDAEGNVLSLHFDGVEYRP